MCSLRYHGSRREDMSLPHSLFPLRGCCQHISSRRKSFKRLRREIQGSLRPKFITWTPVPSPFSQYKPKTSAKPKRNKGMCQEERIQREKRLKLKLTFWNINSTMVKDSMGRVCFQVDCFLPLFIPQHELFSGWFLSYWTAKSRVISGRVGHYL